VTDWSGEEYARLGGLQRRMISEALSSLEFGPSDRVLDIGCGDGFLTAAIAKLTPQGLVVGADRSPRMVATAETTATGEESRPWFVLADALALPFTRCFDAAVSFNALHWVPEQQRALEQIAAALKPGGSATIQMVCAGPRPSLEAVTMTLCGEARWAPWFHGFEAPFVHVDPDRYADLAATAGLTLDEATVADREWDFGSREALLQWSAMGCTAWTDRLPVERRGEFIAEQVDSYEEISGAAGLFRFMQLRAVLHRR